jgi:rhomboid protease GluP
VPKLRITYNAPVVLTFTLLAVAVFCLNELAPSTREWFIAYPDFDHGARSWVGLFSHTLGHANWQHLLGNFMLVLLIGPILEERHGSKQLLTMIVITALITGLVNATFSSYVLLGASGIVFMMIVLASTANIRQAEIPLTFIAVAVVYMGGELVAALKANDGISHMAHLVGGASGGALGFIGARAREPKLPKAITGEPVKPKIPMVTGNPPAPTKVTKSL